MKFLIQYIEDNELGVYDKMVLIESDSIYEAVSKCAEDKLPLLGIWGAGQLTKEQEDYYTHESQDQIRKSYMQMGTDLGNKGAC